MTYIRKGYRFLYWLPLAFGFLALPAFSSDPFTEPNADEFFGLTKLYSIHLQFTADQWTAIEPATPGGFPGQPPFSGDRLMTPANPGEMERPAGDRGMRRERGPAGDRKSVV